MDRALDEPELIPVNPEAVVELSRVDLSANGAAMAIWRERIELEHRTVARAAATLSGEERLLAGNVERPRACGRKLAGQAIRERAELHVRHGDACPQRVIAQQET